jgi:Tfp pilus assembly protein PilV
MLKRLMVGGERGDTLIEVTFALAILGFVLLGSTAIAATAFRTGQTARERTEISQAAQEQLEALRSFRDNHTWAEFRSGSTPLYQGVDGASSSSNCVFDATKKCFHMELASTTAGTTEWVPVAGASTASNVPTSNLEITINTAAPDRNCGYQFDLEYSFEPVGSVQPATNHITTRLANLKYEVPAGGSAQCN